MTNDGIAFMKYVLTTYLMPIITCYTYLVVKPACHIAKLFFPCVIFGDQKSAGHSGRAQYAHLAS